MTLRKGIFSLLPLLVVNAWAFPGPEMSLKSVAYTEYSRSLVRAYRQCSSRPQIQASSEFLFSENFLSNVKDGHLTDSEKKDRRRHGLSGARDLILSASHKGSLVTFGDTNEKGWLPDEEFTVDLWVKPDSGQDNPAVILTAEDICSPFKGEGWEMGIASTSNGERNPHYYARVESTSGRVSSLKSPTIIYEPNRWVHLVLTRDEDQSKLFVNGARVGRSFGSKGKLFQRLHLQDSPSSCRKLWLGGGFRGRIAVARLWKKALRDQDVPLLMRTPLYPKNYSNVPRPGSLLLWENFEGGDRWDWSSVPSTPQLLPSSFQPDLVDLSPDIPPCGFTTCDVPEIVESYVKNWELRTSKVIRYNIINVKNNDGSNETVTKKQMNSQNRALAKAFNRFNITWEYQEVPIRDSVLRRKNILIGCKPEFIGNGDCEPECSKIPNSNNDGGDCDFPKRSCKSSRIGNGRCDPSCNVGYHRWDGGDCCDTLITDTSLTCLDPSSPNRAFLSLEEYKKIISAPSNRGVNVYFASWDNKDIVGLATFPWENEALTSLGGVLVRPEDYGVEGQMDTLVHEFGHVLGLWHVHRGVSELVCDHPCFESKASMLMGDLCSDTEPTLAHSSCRDPEDHRTRCGVGPFKNTPFNNYMSYSDDQCTDTFTSQQVARMHCYVDLAYPSWLVKNTDVRPPPAPLAPRVTSRSKNHVILGWIPPLNKARYLEDEGRCSSCTPERGLFQFGHVATGYGEPFRQHLSPQQATGPPDAESCFPSVKSWMPDPIYCEPLGISSKQKQREACSLSISFKIPVIPHSLSIWMNYNARLGLSDVQLIFEDRSTASLGPARSTCAEKFTFVISQVLPWISLENERKKVTGVVLFASSSLVSVDAVQLVSISSHSFCSSCKPLRYRVLRNHPFHDGQNYQEVDKAVFHDHHVESGITYHYRVQAYLGDVISDPSPSLTYRLGHDVCGDGVLYKLKEECDDGNLLSGDGCNQNCRVEDGFKCSGFPSVCYWHEGDEVCEPSERYTVVEDCGYVTPPGFSDQWAQRVETLAGYDNTACPVSIIAGPPVIPPKECNLAYNSTVAWRPCVETTSIIQFDAYFKDPVVAASISLFLESDGKLISGNDDYDYLRKKMGRIDAIHSDVAIDLIGLEGDTVFAGSVALSCAKNPATVSVHQDLTKPFKLTKGIRVRFGSTAASFTAIRLRSLQFWNPFVMPQCLKDSVGSLYNPISEKCVKYHNCERPSCQEPRVKNGKLNCTGYGEGDQCSLTCDAGYYLPNEDSKNLSEETFDKNMKTSSTVTCVDGDWFGDSLICRPVDCQQPRLPHADALCPDGTTYGRNCTFKCRPPARLRSVHNGVFGSSAAVTCTKKGLWSEPEPFCHLSCPAPSAPENSVLTDESCEKRKSFAYGQRCKFRCRNGYKVDSELFKSDSFYASCEGSGIWSGRVCVPVTCPAPDMTEGGVLLCTDGLRFGSTCVLECPNHESQKKDGDLALEIENLRFISTGTCESDGKWSVPFRACPAITDNCPSPLLDASVSVLCGGYSDTRVFPIGHKCSLLCLEMEHELFAPLEANGLSLMELKIRCTGQGRWYPDPMLYICDLKCRSESFNDTYCDAINNRAPCKWDEGDCCESTLKVKGQKVKVIPQNCGERCHCLQPGAS